MTTTLLPEATVRLCGTVHAADDIYSPYGYARQVFGHEVESINYRAEGKSLHFNMGHRIKFRSVESWIKRLLTDTDDNVTFYVKDENGTKHKLDDVV